MPSPVMGSPASPNHRAGAPYSTIGNNLPLSPASPSSPWSPTLSYGLSSPASSSGSGCGSWTSRPPTPAGRSHHPDSTVQIQQDGVKEKISPDMISEHYMNVARRLAQPAQSRTASPHPSPNTRRTTSPKDSETEMTGDSAPAVPPPLPVSFDWWTLQSLDGPLTLDELPDSKLWYLPEYQLTEEWFERIISELAEADEEKRVEGELDVDMGMGAEMMDLDIETVVGVETQGSSRAQLGRPREQ